MKKIGKYLLEVSVVVIGVAITLLVSYFISVKNNQRDVTLYLNTMKIELEENMKVLDKEIEDLQLDVRYSDYLRSHHKDSLNADTLKIYENIWYRIQAVNYQTNGFEIFKSSGMMRLIEDKELLLSIWNVYDDIEDIHSSNEVFFNIKWEDIKKETTILLEDKENTDFIPMYNYYVLGQPYNIMNLHKKAKEKCEEALSKLDENL